MQISVDTIEVVEVILKSFNLPNRNTFRFVVRRSNLLNINTIFNHKNRMLGSLMVDFRRLELFVNPYGRGLSNKLL